MCGTSSEARGSLCRAQVYRRQEVLPLAESVADGQQHGGGDEDVNDQRQAKRREDCLGDGALRVLGTARYG